MSTRVWVTMMLKTAWERLLSLFMLVAATVRDLFPSLIRLSMSCSTNKNNAHIPKTNNNSNNNDFKEDDDIRTTTFPVRVGGGCRRPRRLPFVLRRSMYCPTISHNNDLFNGDDEL